MHPSSFSQFGEVKRLTAAPIASTEFRDERPLEEIRKAVKHEVRGYQVRAVNARGVESGPSPLALSLTSSVPRARATERPDGSTAIEWEPVPEKGIQGYAVYRMDDIWPSLCVRLTSKPVSGTSFVDWCEAPRGERRCYYVVAVDALGEEGLPSSEAFSFGRP
jgi:hypothetical protein